LALCWPTAEKSFLLLSVTVIFINVLFELYSLSTIS
jgi:hypothetical protein